MANLSQTAANVKLKNQGPFGSGVAGATITQGQPLYESGGQLLLCDNNDGIDKAVVVGISLTPATSGGTVIYALPGSRIDLGATLTVGETYILSATAGAIAPIADLAPSNYLTILGAATDSSTLMFNPLVTNTLKP
jgi:hypothetical protein